MSTRYDVRDLLDLYYAKDGHEPDWAAIMTRLSTVQYPRDTARYLLSALWAIHEEADDTAAQATLLWVLTA